MRNNVPITTRLAIEIPKPKDWQAFQRNCVLLYRSELQDPHAQEYGRSGQSQGGIDILGRRGGRTDHFVGVQCRLILKPLKEKKILSDARAALKLRVGLKELIFVTTAPDDTGAADAAIAVTRLLQAEGHELTIIVYGWGQLQTLIALHDLAYAAFQPSVVGSSSVQNLSDPNGGPIEFASLIATHLIEQLRGAALTVGPREGTADAKEDPALHARIDIFRDLFKDQRQTLLAQIGLLNILKKEDLSAKPWARYRLETNLGSISLDLGRDAEAAARFETAHAIRPSDPNALANLALARTIQGRFDEATAAAGKALNSEPPVDHAVGYLLQAAARSNWQGDPETLIPDRLIGSAQADIGLAEFLRRRDVPDWAKRTLGIARRHSDVPDFKRIRAIAVLSLAIESDTIIPGGRGAVTAAELNSAADDMKAVAEHCLDVGFADAHDLTAYVNNAAVLLRLCERHVESEALLVRGISKVGKEPQLYRLLAVARLVQNRVDEAIATLDGDTDPENQILLAELHSVNNLADGLREALAVDATDLSSRLQRLRWRLIGELALRLADRSGLDAAVSGLRALDPNDVSASLLEILVERRTAADDEVIQTRLRALALSVPATIDTISRYLIAVELRNRNLPEEASRLLDGQVDLTRQSPMTSLYLQSLAAARRDAAFQAALEEAAPEVRNDTETLWTISAHAWNLGDLSASMFAVNALLAQKPDQPRARLLKIEILIRLNRSAELFDELEKPLERLAWREPTDQFRLASLLSHFGFTARAADSAYELFIRHRDLSRAWMTLSMLVLDEGRGQGGEPRPWDANTAQANTAVDLTYDDGSNVFFVIEPSAELRKLDTESWEPNHALVRVVTGLQAGARFVGPDGREGVVQRVRHKYVARLHYVLQNHEARFPEILGGFRRLSVNFEQPGGLDQLIAQVKARHDWVRDEESGYHSGPMPLGVLAYRVGSDTIEVAAGIAGNGGQLKVALGNIEERVAARSAVGKNMHRGCVLDLWTFWTAWRLGALEGVHKTCGPIHLAQGVLDRLRERRERLQFSARDGQKNAGYENGKLVLQEISAGVVVEARDEIDRAITWIESNALICPVIASDDLPSALREHLRLGRGGIFEALILTRQTGMLLITDDLPIRELHRAIGGDGGTWLHAVLGLALERRYIAPDRYIVWTANLIETGHNHLGVSGLMLARAAKLDAHSGSAPGYLFQMLIRMIGGRVAEPVSHLEAVTNCLRDLWNDSSTLDFRKSATDDLLRQIVRERKDYAELLWAIILEVRDCHYLVRYLEYWLRGHFLSDAVVFKNNKAE
ncbi:MAG: hypothetical protein JWR10_4372 [Rubritepida sp.]|nr:hypothetical protein [Rubritepida sp.]